MTRKPSPRIIPGGDFAYDLDRIEAKRTGHWPDVPAWHRARSYGALVSPTNKLVEKWERCVSIEQMFDCAEKLRRP